MSSCASFSSRCLTAARVSILIWNIDNIKYDHFKFLCKKKKKERLYIDEPFCQMEKWENRKAAYLRGGLFFPRLCCARGVKTALRLFFYLRKVRRRAAKRRAKLSGREGGKSGGRTGGEAGFKKTVRHKEKGWEGGMLAEGAGEVWKAGIFHTGLPGRRTHQPEFPLQTAFCLHLGISHCLYSLLILLLHTGLF